MATFQLDANGNVVGEFARPQPGIPNTQVLAENDPKVVAWRSKLTWDAHRQVAISVMSASNDMMMQIVEAAALNVNTLQAADVQAYVQYRQALRAIIDAPTGDPTASPIPAQPAAPKGTKLP